MKRWLLALLLAVTAPLAAQKPAPESLLMSRPGFAVMGQGVFPMMMVDEGNLRLERLERIQFPRKYWDEMQVCLAKLGKAKPAGEPPAVYLIPVAQTFRVHDLTLDSLMYAGDSTFKGIVVGPPTIGYSLIHTNVIILAERYRANKYVLRHEALHFLLWRNGVILGHPVEYFGPCDRDYE